MLSLTNENGYAGLGSRALLLAAQAIIVADVLLVQLIIKIF